MQIYKLDSDAHTRRIEERTTSANSDIDHQFFNEKRLALYYKQRTYYN